jgi:hypothetical protein
VSLAALNFAGGDLAAGHRGWLSQPDRSAAFRDNVQAAAGIAGRVGLEYKPADPADSPASFGWLTATMRGSEPVTENHPGVLLHARSVRAAPDRRGDNEKTPPILAKLSNSSTVSLVSG